MRKRPAITLALGTATALGFLATAAQAESVAPPAGQPAAKGPMALTADQMDSVTAGQAFSASFSASNAASLSLGAEELEASGFSFSFSSGGSSSGAVSFED